MPDLTPVACVFIDALALIHSPVKKKKKKLELTIGREIVGVVFFFEVFSQRVSHVLCPR